MGKGRSPADEADELRELIRRAHEATKDIRQALRDWREEAGKIVSQNLAQISTVLDATTQVIGERLAEFQDEVTSSVPVQVLCAGCGTLNAALGDPTKMLSCNGCGQKFLLRATLREQAAEGQGGRGGRD